MQGGHGIKGFSIVFSLGAFRPPGPSLYRDCFLNLLPLSVGMFSTFSSCQDPCLAQNPGVRWIGTGALQSAQIWSPTSRLRNSSLEDHLEPPRGIGVCKFLAGQDGTHCLDPSFMLYVMCFLCCCYRLLSHKNLLSPSSVFS